MAHGHFVWCELMTTDTAAATDFYRSVIGWTAQDAGLPDIAYTIFSAGDVRAAGLMAQPQEARDAGAPPRWMGHIAVDDVDATVAKIQAMGGSILHAPSDIPNIGRFAVVRDPQGAAFALFQPRDESSPPPPAGSTPGRVGWHELYAANWETAFAFYADLFGWTKADAIDMGPMGTYQLCAVDGVPIGGMMTKPESMSGAPPTWGFYFNVDSADAAIRRLTEGGGQVLDGPHQVPGGSWIVQARDPQGAAFAVVSSVA